MPCRPIIPDRDIILVPLETDLGVVVLGDELILGLLEIVPVIGRFEMKVVLGDLR
jgi:hypothetical protein